jgi:hypothetical protein
MIYYDFIYNKYNLNKIILMNDEFNWIFSNKIVVCYLIG